STPTARPILTPWRSCSTSSSTCATRACRSTCVSSAARCGAWSGSAGGRAVATRPLRVVHVVTKLAIGGAQESAIATCAGLPPDRFEQTLLSGIEVDEEGSLLSAATEQGVAVAYEPALVR